MLLLGELSYILKEKIVSFECGIERYKITRVSFSIQFFFIRVIFILFDIEIIFLIHFCFYLNT